MHCLCFFAEHWYVIDTMLLGKKSTGQMSLIVTSVGLNARTSIVTRFRVTYGFWQSHSALPKTLTDLKASNITGSGI